MRTERNEDMRWRKLEAITCFVIRRERCSRIFRDRNKNSLTLIREILIEHHNFQCFFQFLVPNLICNTKIV